MTLSGLKVRLPARAGLGSNEPSSYQVSSEICSLIYQQCGGVGKLTKLNGSFDDLQGYYRFEQEHRSLFLKVIPDSYLEQQEEANMFAVFVQNAAVSTSTIISGFPKKLNDALVIFAYDWVEGRSLQSTPLELEQFGYQLGRLHKVLGNYPHRQLVMARTQDRLATLRSIAERVLKLKKIESPYLQRLNNLLNNKTQLFDTFNEPCQVLHGDLNIGNLRWTESGVVFLDFEDTKHSWLPRRIDMAFVLERIVLVNETDNDQAFLSAKSLLKGYIESFGSSPFIEKGAFFNSLEWLSARSLCMLQYFEWEGSSWPESEWLKFNGLLEHMARRSDLIFEIEACFFDR